MECLGSKSTWIRIDFGRLDPVISWIWIRIWLWILTGSALTKNAGSGSVLKQMRIRNTAFIDCLIVLVPIGYWRRFLFLNFSVFFQEKEIDYCHILNRNLPDDIKVTAWAPCPTTTFRCLTFPPHKESFDLNQFFLKRLKCLQDQDRSQCPNI
jgi:hypothetical protein